MPEINNPLSEVRADWKHTRSWCAERDRALDTYHHALARYELDRRQREEDRRQQEKEFWLALRGADIEEQAAALFQNLGYSVTTTPVTGDEGIDLRL